MSGTNDSGSDPSPPEQPAPGVVANQLDKIKRKHKDDLSVYEKSWIDGACEWLRYLASESDQ